MKTPLIISNVLTGIALAILGVLNILSVRTQQNLQENLAVASDQIADLESEASAATAARKALEAQILELDASLGDAKSRLTVAEAAKVQLSRELARTTNQLQVSAGHEEELNLEISELHGELLAATSRPTAETAVIAGYQDTITRLEQQLAAARTSIQGALHTTMATLTTSRGRTASVVSVGPSSAFVVINYGASHGALPEQRLAIRRGTETLAAVHISDVRENLSIAQVRPGTLQAALHKGDSAVLTE